MTGIFMCIYALKASLLMGAMWAAYACGIRSEKLLHVNRFVLLSVVLLSMLLPLLPADFVRSHVFSGSEVVVVLPMVEVTGEQYIPKTVEESSYSLTDWLMGISLTVTGMLLVWKAFSLWQMFHTVRRKCYASERIRSVGPIRFHCPVTVCHLAGTSPSFSWMHTIMMSQEDEEEGKREILLHESAHISRGHSYDVLFLNIVQAIFWFNPFIYLLMRDMSNVHEFEADDDVLHAGVSMRDYQNLLIKKAVGSSSYTFANSFNHSSLKKRITMMLQQNPSPWRSAKSLYVALVAVGTVGLLSVPQFAQGVSAKCKGTTNSLASQLVAFKLHTAAKSIQTATLESQSEVLETVSQNQTKMEPLSMTTREYSYTENSVEEKKDSISPQGEPVLDEVDVMPEYPGGRVALMKFLMENVRYPQAAIENNITGRVIVRFVVEKDGKISNVKVEKSVDPTLDAEAKRVVQAMPKWNPGKRDGQLVRVKYALPVTFRLSAE